MPIAPAGKIEKIIETKIAESMILPSLGSPPWSEPEPSPPEPIDDGIYKRLLKDPEEESPFSIYFFYMRIDRNGALNIDHYFYFDGPPDDPTQWKRIPFGDIEKRIKMLAENGRPGNRNPLPLRDHNFEHVVFRRRSYVAFFLDEANWSFHKRLAPYGRYAMVFNKKKAKADNYSFFDAQDLAFLMDNSEGGQSIRTGVVLINHMLDQWGNPLPPGATQEFHFDMYFDVNFAVTNNQRMVVIFDPTGTNQGPPEQP